MKFFSRLFVIVLICVMYSVPLPAVEDIAARQLMELVDVPTAGTLPHKSFSIDLRLYPEGGALVGGTLGLLDRVNTSVYFGGENLIGEGEINWNPQIGIDLRVRAIHESTMLPGIAVGFSTQGWDGYDKTLKRYTIKARGFYLIASRNYWLLGNFGIHGGINKSIENDDSDDDINIFVGIDKALFKGIELLIEYDFASNDNKTDVFGEGNGYLNAGIRWAVTGNIYFEVDFKNLTKNRPRSADVSRVIKCGFMRSF